MHCYCPSSKHGFTGLGFLSLGTLALASLLQQSPLVNLVYQFPEPTWLENLAIRKNGSILVTELTKPRLWQLNPYEKAQHPWLVAEILGYDALLGIAETKPDSFVVAAGNFSLTAPLTPGTFSIWSASFAPIGKEDGEQWQDWGPSNSDPVVSKVVDVPQAILLNGVLYLGPKEDKLLMADSVLGVIFRVDLRTLKVDIAIDDPLMKICGSNNFIGVNGIKLLGNELYFTNTMCGFLARIPIQPDGTPSGPSSVVSRPQSASLQFDDFAIDNSGTAYLATGNRNAITEVSPNGQARTLAGDLNSTKIANPTSVAFGRTTADKRTLYVTTNGGLGHPIDGDITIGGQVVAVEL